MRAYALTAAKRHYGEVMRRFICMIDWLRRSLLFDDEGEGFSEAAPLASAFSLLSHHLIPSA